MPPVLRINPENPDESIIAKAVEMLKKGGVIAYPTETFYGLGADIRNVQAIDRIYAIKERDFNKPILIIIGQREDVEKFAKRVPEAAVRLMDRFWPGGITLVFEASSNIPERLTAGTGKIGIRLSSNLVATRLAKSLSGAITSTSANISGGKECAAAEEVIKSTGEKLDAVIDGGRTPGGMGSTIVDITFDPPVILREGIIPSQEILRR
jgi:L-threonylcarbamoyladenylate synthase